MINSILFYVKASLILNVKVDPNDIFYTTPTYTLPICCSDGQETATANLVVEIQPNIAPTLAFTQGNLSIADLLNSENWNEIGLNKKVL